MKVNVRTTNQQRFDVEVDDAATVAVLKGEIIKMKDDFSDPAAMKCIYRGRVLPNETSLESLKMDDRSFVMISYKRPAASQAPLQPSAGEKLPNAAKTPSEPPKQTVASPASAEAVPKPSADASAAPAAESAPAQTGELPPAEEANQALADFEESVSHLISMGFDPQKSRNVLQHVGGNREMAIEVLLNDQQGVSDEPIDEGGIRAGLEGFANNQEFQAVRAMVRNNPDLIEPLIQHIGERNPQLFQWITNNRDLFLRIINSDPGLPQASNPLQQQQQRVPSGMGQIQGGLPGLQGLQGMQGMRGLPGEGSGTAPPVGSAEDAAEMASPEAQGQMPTDDPMITRGPGDQVFIHLTQEEMNDIQTLENLGFTRQQCIQAYMVCEKNVDLAASYLFQVSEQAEAGFGNN